MSGTLSTDDENLFLDDATLGALGLDPWKDAGWSAEGLRALRDDLVVRVEQERAAAESRLVARHRRAHLEDWMRPLLERELACNRAYHAACLVLPLAGRALATKSRLLFLAD